MLTVNLPELLSDVRWGDVPGWFSAIGTVGALLLGFRLLLRDRRKEEESQAAQVICWLKQGSAHVDTAEPQTATYTVYATNGSQHPVFNVELQVIPFSRREINRRWKGYSRNYRAMMRKRIAAPSGITLPLDTEDGSTLRPQEVASTEHDFDSYMPYHLCVEFTDGQGVRWSRDLETQRLRQAWRAGRPIY